MSDARSATNSCARKGKPTPVLGPSEPAQSESSRLEAAALYRLMTWLSPAYPVGAFAYSGGIEWAVETGDICNAETLRFWIEAMLGAGAGLCDAILFSHVHRAVERGDDAAVKTAAELAVALVPTRERFHETTRLGRAFLDVTGAAWPCVALERLPHIWPGPVAYPVAVATAGAGHGIPLGPALRAFVTALASNWVSAGVRLIPLGHTEGQLALRALEAAVEAAAQQACAASLDAIGSTTFRADLASARHETQYTRLFLS